jgi:hypothetical protein
MALAAQTGLTYECVDDCTWRQSHHIPMIGVKKKERNLDQDESNLTLVATARPRRDGCLGNIKSTSMPWPDTIAHLD